MDLEELKNHSLSKEDHQFYCLGYSDTPNEGCDKKGMDIDTFNKHKHDCLHFLRKENRILHDLLHKIKNKLMVTDDNDS